jgi:hypothetical protein
MECTTTDTYIIKEGENAQSAKNIHISIDVRWRHDGVGLHNL